MPNEQQPSLPYRMLLGDPAKRQSLLGRVGEWAGVEPESPLGQLGDWTVSDALEGLGRSMKSGLLDLTKAPQTRVPVTTPQVQAPSMFTAQRSPVSEVGPPSGFPQSAGERDVPGAYGQGMVRGSFTVGGPNVPQTAALEGLRRHQPTYGNQASTEELYRRSFPARHQQEYFVPGEPGRRVMGTAGTFYAPGVQDQAQQQLQDRIGEEAFERALRQKEQEARQMARVGLDPAAQLGAELTARRAAYPSQAQAEGLSTQALYNFLGRRETAESAVAGRQAQRDAAALNTLERAMSQIMGREDLTPEDQAELQRLRESIELVRRGVYFLSDLFDDSQLDELADLSDLEGQF